MRLYTLSTYHWIVKFFHESGDYKELCGCAAVDESAAGEMFSSANGHKTGHQNTSMQFTLFFHGTNGNILIWRNYSATMEGRLITAIHGLPVLITLF